MTCLTKRLAGYAFSLTLSLTVATPAGALWNPTHVSGPVVYDGAWDIHEPAFAETDPHLEDGLTSDNPWLKPLSRKNFGTTLVLLPNREGGLSPVMERARPGVLPREMYIRELHYPLFRNQAGETILYPTENQQRRYEMGQRVVPVADGNYLRADQARTEKTADGREVRGSEEVDQLLRNAFAGMQNGRADYIPQDPNSPIFALASYSRPNYWISTLKGLTSESTYKVQGGLSHMGSYIGRGHTRNAPTGYHGNSWEVSRRPALLHTVEFEGAGPKIFNRNAVIATKVLNEFNGGPAFPSNYDFDHYRAFSLREVLNFYRAWIDVNWVRDQDRPENGGDGVPFYQKLRSDETWFVYCAEHIVLALNVAVNVAHNRRGFQDIWGEVDGAKLWDLLVHRWNNDNQVPVLRPEPSWVDEWLDWRAWVGELSASRFRPWPPAPAPDTGGTWENIPLENSVPEGDEFFRPLWKFEGIHNPNAIATPGRSLAFPAQTTADLSQQFLTQYADWTTVGPVFSTALLMGFMGEIQRRTGISEQRFLELTVGIMAEMFKFDAAMEFSKFIVQRGGALPSGDALAPIAEQFSGQAFTRYRNGLRLVAIPDPVADAIISGASQLAFIQTHAEAWAKQPNEQLRYSWARDQFSRAVRPLFRAAQREPVALSLEAQAIAGVMYVEYYTPPVIAHEMALGSYPSHQRVRFTTIASVFAAADVERSSTPESRRRLCPYQGQELIGEECGVIKP